MIVVLTETAIEDLVSIGRHIAGHNPQRAETFVADLKSRCHQLATMPKAFALVPRHEDTGIRRRPYKNYLIFYRAAGDSIEILHVLHGAQDYESILFGEELTSLVPPQDP
jgi:plasmid stabilization system protein ParE